MRISSLCLCCLSNAPESAPAVAVMPGYLDVPGVYIFPPLLEFVAGNVECRWGDKVVEDDVVLNALAELAEVGHIIVVEQLRSDRLCGRVGRAVDKLCREEKAQCRQL